MAKNCTNNLRNRNLVDKRNRHCKCWLKRTAVKMKTIILGLDSSSGREGRIHLEVSVRQTMFYELDWHKTKESGGTIQETVIFEEYEGGKDDAQSLCNIKAVLLLEWKDLLVSVLLQTVFHWLVAGSAISLSRKFFYLWQGYFILTYTMLQAAFFWFLCVNILCCNLDTRWSL